LNCGTTVLIYSKNGLIIGMIVMSAQYICFRNYL